MARAPIPYDTRRRLSERDPQWQVKAILRVVCTVFALWAMILFAISCSYTNQHFINSDGNGDWPDGLALAPVSVFLSLLAVPLPSSRSRSHGTESLDENKKTSSIDRVPRLVDTSLHIQQIPLTSYHTTSPLTSIPNQQVTLSIIYNTLSLLLLFIFRRGIHFHPAWHITLDFLLLSLCIPAMIFSITGGLFWYWRPALLNSAGQINCEFLFFNEWARECNPVAYTIGSMQIAGIVFLFLVFILHFTLFTLACIDTRKWRKTSTRTKDHRSNSDSNSNDDDAMQLPYQPHHDAEHACPPAYTPQGQEVASKDESSVEERPVGGT
ncbi:hypothetical protein MMC24_001334 [Lignoscripta atroalba]|nr:hypothetical protein [Lignoscripta atroalba]